MGESVLHKTFAGSDNVSIVFRLLTLNKDTQKYIIPISFQKDFFLMVLAL
jgi:hypothetical protein